MTYIDALAQQIEAALPEGARPAEHAVELYRLYALLVLTQGTSTTLVNVHDAWSTWMSAHDPSHASLIPFAELDRQTQLEDQPYLDAIHHVARSR